VFARAEQEPVEPGAVDEGGPLTMTMFRSSPESNPGWEWGMDPVTQILTERTGVSLDIEYATTSDNQELYTKIAAGRELPDFIKFMEYDPALIAEGVFLPLNQIADDEYPEFWDQLWTDYEKIHADTNGDIYYMNANYADVETLSTLPYGSKLSGTHIVHANMNVMNQLGYTEEQVVNGINRGQSVIQTLADLKDLALRAKEFVEYPIYLMEYKNLTVSRWALTYMQVITQSYNGPDVVYPLPDGTPDYETVSFNVRSEEYKKAARYLNDLYRSGLIHPENFTFTRSLTDQNVKRLALAGDIAFIIGEEGSIWQHRRIPEIPDIKDQFLWWGQDILLGEGVSRDELVTGDFNWSNIGSQGGWYITKDADYPGRALEFLMAVASDEIQLMFYHGIQGANPSVPAPAAWFMDYTYDPVGGFVTQTDEYARDLRSFSDLERLAKYGTNNGVMALRTRYVQGFSYRPLHGVENINGVNQILGLSTPTIGTNYATPFKTSILTCNFRDQEEKLLFDNVMQVWQDGEVNLVLANSNAEFEAAYDKLIRDMERTGLKQLEVLMTARYREYDDALGETRNDRWKLQ
jgi:ABC-type glycerol-3-phosphate transport system substrate-binding protein